jgi:hypothetical protein
VVTADQVQILNPAPGTLLDIPAATVVVRFPVGANVQLRVNGRAVSNDQIGRTETDSGTNLVTQTWYGVSLAAGENQITVVAIDSEALLAAVEVAVRGAPIEMRIAPRGSSTPADGRSIATIQGELLDEAGNRSNWNAVVTLNASGGDFVGVDAAPDQPGFQVEAQQGRFTADLQAPLEANPVQVQAVTNGLEAFNQVQFVTPQRPSIATGVIDLRLGARGTNYYSSFRDFLPLDEDNSYGVDINAALFAMGNLGEWLFTGALNSERPLNEDCQGQSTLFRQSSGVCDSIYPIYGDDSSRDVMTPSLDSFFVRLERTSPYEGAGTDYFMWGDYGTQEFSQPSQLFTATNRELHGFKFNYNLGDLAITGLYGDNIDGFQRDILVPDGTSGYYFLSRRLLLPGSEVVFLEWEELNRPGTVIEAQRLYRGTDYQIDYDRGTLLFNDPIFRTEVDDLGQVLVSRIVANYQYESQAGNNNLFAGRFQYNLGRVLNQDSWVGATYLTENQDDRNYQLYGADTQIVLGDRGQLLAEFAHSQNNFALSGPISGSAYRVELDGAPTDWLAGRVYWRTTDPGFTNAATTTFVPGQTRYGAEADFSISEETSLWVGYDHEDNFGIAPRPLLNLADLLEPGISPTLGSRVDNSLTTYGLALSQRLGDSTLDFGWTHRDRTDRLDSEALNVASDQLNARLTTPVADNVTLTAQTDLTLSSESDPLYPTRTLFGLDWELMPGVDFEVNQIFYGENGFNDGGSLTTIGISGEYQPWQDATIRGRFTTIEGQQLGGAIGFEQGFTLAPGLYLDLGYEHVFNTFYGSTAAGVQFPQPYAVGTGASALGLTSGNSYSIGLAYTDNPDWQASARFEHSTSSQQGSNTVFTASALGRLTPALSALFNYQLASAANQRLGSLPTTSVLKLGLAYRDPNSDKLNALLSYEHRINPNTIPNNLLFGSSLNTSEHLFSAEAVYAPTWQWELYAKYAFRNSTTRIGLPEDVGGTFRSSNSLNLAQLRATYRFDYRWDVSTEARWVGGLNSYNELGYALELGYYPTPDFRVYAGYSGGANDNDFGVNRSASGFYLGVAAKINELFNGFGLQNVAPAQQQESGVVDPAIVTDMPEDSAEGSAPAVETTDPPAATGTDDGLPTPSTDP